MQVILMAVGDDRPGLASALADAVVGARGNWLESHFARLGGKFVGSVLVELPDDRVGDLAEAVAAMEATGFHVTLTTSQDDARPGGRVLTFELVGADRPGIVREVSAALAALGVNIDELESETETGAMSAERLFRARARVQVPDGTPTAQVRQALERISGEIMVDFAD
ncbi:MAG: ACT domain-containing protein [Sphingomonadales bacterium]|nr:ACT domain-containing protein [Sphingomonadales bacterium]MDE2568861.1 ACT domain-containing protein [Sphingomonadales bacterium]